MNEERVQTEYTPEERARMLGEMHAAANAFYAAAQRIGYHQFLELTGFMREIIKVCEREHAEGRDFATSDLRLKGYEAAYIGEKLGCILGAALSEPGAWAGFVEKLRGELAWLSRHSDEDYENLARSHAGLSEELRRNDDLEEKLFEERDRSTRLRRLLDRDRTGLAAALSGILRECNGSIWIAEGRGAYEWDDDRYRDETRAFVLRVMAVAREALARSGRYARAAFHEPGEPEVPFGYDELEAANQALVGELRGLLARIHGDGGHYVVRHGQAKAIVDAHIVVAFLRSELTETKASLAAIKRSDP